MSGQATGMRQQTQQALSGGPPCGFEMPHKPASAQCTRLLVLTGCLWAMLTQQNKPFHRLAHQSAATAAGLERSGGHQRRCPPCVISQSSHAARTGSPGSGVAPTVQYGEADSPSILPGSLQIVTERAMMSVHLGLHWTTRRHGQTSQYEILKYYQSTSRLHANVLQSLAVHQQSLQRCVASSREQPWTLNSPRTAHLNPPPSNPEISSCPGVPLSLRS